MTLLFLVLVAIGALGALGVALIRHTLVPNRHWAVKAAAIVPLIVLLCAVLVLAMNAVILAGFPA